jgi:hypothetical protein
MWISIRNFLMQSKVVLWAYILVTIVASLHLYIISKHVAIAPPYTDYNNYVIFKLSFFHLLDGKNLYIHHLTEQWDLYKYSPTFALAMGVLAKIPDYIAMPAWNLLNALALYGAVRKLPFTTRNQTLMLWFILLELLTSLQNTQSNGLMAALMIGTYNSLQSGKAWKAALWVALAAFIKIYAVIVVCLFIFYPDKLKFIGWGLVWTILLAVLPLVVISPQMLMWQYNNWVVMMGQDEAVSYGMSVLGWLHTWFGLNGGKGVVTAVGIVLFFVPFATLTASGGVTYRWSPSTGLSATTGSAPVSSPTLTTNYTVTGTDVNGCVNRSYPIVTVNNVPSLPAITGTASVCVGSIATLSDIVTLPPGTWSSNNTAIASVTGYVGPGLGDPSNGVVSGISAGTTTSTYSATNTCGTSYVTQSITVNSLPTISGSSVTICNGSSATLTATGSVTYTWSPGASLSTTTGASVMASPTVTTNYTVTGTNANGCVNRAYPIVTVINLPTVSAISGSSTTLCAGTNLTLTDATPGGTWSSSIPAAATVNSSGVVYGVAGGTTNISYTVTNSCGTTTVTYAITVNPLPNAGVITPTASGKVFVCQNSNVTITSSGDAGGTWAISVAGFATISSSGTVYGVFGPASVPVISYTVSNSCGTAYDTIKLTVKGIPRFSGIPNACVNTSSHVTGVPATANVAWMLGSPAFTETVVGTVASYTVNAAGSDTVVITVPTETATYCAGTLKVPIKGNPIPVQPVISGVNYVTSGGTITLTSATGGTGLWGSSNPSAATGSGAGVSKLISAVGSIGSSTTISLTFTLFPCTLSDTQMVTVVSPKGIAPGETELGAGDVLSVYPNPSGGAFTIQLPAGSGTAAITIADITGKIVYAKITGKDKLDFDLGDYPRGMYTINVTAGEKKYREKVLIE